jgi:hypothetical protein
MSQVNTRRQHPPEKPLPEVEAARRDLKAARGALGTELDGLTAAIGSALDVPAKVRKDPIKAAALAGGTGFLLLGGPRRIIRAASSRLLPKRRKERGLLPKDVERILRSSDAGKDPRVRQALEDDFADFLARKGRLEPEPSASRSFWRTYDSLVGPIGTVAARLLVERLFAAGSGSKQSPRRQSPSASASPPTARR